MMNIGHYRRFAGRRCAGRRFAGVSLASALVGLAATAEAASPPAADLSGTWLLTGYSAKLVPQHGAIPFTAEGRAQYQKNALQLGKDPTRDAAHSDCLPPGVSRAMGEPYPFEIIQSAGQVDFIYEVNRAYRVVLLQEHHQDPEVWDPSYMRDGIGRWEGETLVIDSSNFNAKSWLDDSGLPHSERLHVIERLRSESAGRTLEDKITIEDPAMFTHAWTVRLVFERQKDVSIQTDWVCGEAHRAPSATRAAPADAAASGVTGQAMNGFWNMAPPPRPPGGGEGPPGGRGGPPPPRPPSAAQMADRLQPWALDRLKAMENALAAGELPPTNANQCLPWAIPGNGMPGGPAYAMNIVVTRDKAVFMYQLDHQARIVYLNTEHPAGLAPSYFGHSVGRWEGDMLVIDTIGLNDTTLIHEVVPHTNALHVIEHLRLKATGELEAQSTLEDPGAFKSPLVFTENYVRSDPYQEYVCAENNHEASASAQR